MHLGIYLDDRLNFSKHIKEKVCKSMKGMTLLRFLPKYVDRNVLDLSYKMYVRPHLDYGDVILHNQRADLMKLIERVFLGVGKGLVRRNYMTNLVGSRCLTEGGFVVCPCFTKYPMDLPHLTDHIPKRNVISMSLRNRSDIPPLTRTNRHENSFFPYTIKAWKELDEDVKSKPSIQSFNKSLFDSKRPLGHPLFGICDIFGIRLLTKLRVEFSDLRDHRFNHAFNCYSPMCVQVELKLKLRFIFPYAVRAIQCNVLFFLAKYQTLFIMMCPCLLMTIYSIY